MTVRETITGVVGATLLLSGAVGCVESEASLGIRGVVEFSGSRTSETVQCGTEMDPDEQRRPVLTCNTEVEAGSVNNFLGNATIDIAQFEQRGQIGGSTGEVVGDDQFCSWSTDQYIQAQYGYSSFELTLDTQNRLQDSREVQAEGQGGGGGGFEGLNLNTNDIHLQELIVEFPDADADNLEKTIKLATLAESGGGGAAISFDLFDRGDIGALRQVYQRESGDGGGGATVTLVAEFSVEGETLGERTIESNKFDFPIRICESGCGTTPRCNFQEEGGG